MSSTPPPPPPLLPHQPDPALLESFRYINSMPGKNVRGKMIDCFQIWMDVESSDILDSIKVGECFRSVLYKEHIIAIVIGLMIPFPSYVLNLF